MNTREDLRDVMSAGVCFVMVEYPIIFFLLSFIMCLFISWAQYTPRIKSCWENKS